MPVRPFFSGISLSAFEYVPYFSCSKKVALWKQSFMSNMQETIHDAWCCNIFFQPSKGCLVTDVHRGKILIQKVLAMHACNQPRSGKRCTGLRLILTSCAYRGALTRSFDISAYNPSGYLTSATCIAHPVKQ